jgi:drug/metabolite transporter (DMT)-like permease
MRKLKSTNETVDPVILVIYIGVASLLLNSGLLLVFDSHPVQYTQDIFNLLLVVALTGCAGMTLASYLYYYFKVSWSIVILNLQIVFLFAFDIIVEKEEFSTIELVGCILMFSSNVLLVAMA